jgi:hypothetical protein
VRDFLTAPHTPLGNIQAPALRQYLEGLIVQPEVPAHIKAQLARGGSRAGYLFGSNAGTGAHIPGGPHYFTESSKWKSMRRGGLLAGVGDFLLGQANNQLRQNAGVRVDPDRASRIEKIIADAREANQRQQK